MVTFEDVFGRAPEGTWAAPGRVNLIGEHTDYNEGFVLPFAIDRCCRVQVAGRDDDVVRSWSTQVGEGVDVPIGRAPEALGWSRYVAGVAWALRAVGADVGGVDVLVDSDVPSGAGLSSSAALTCAVALALVDLHGTGGDRTALALAAQRAENDVVGAPVGVMDHMASMWGTPGSALLLDCRDLAVRTIPLRLDETGLTLLVIDTRVRHDHASGGYAERRRSCERAARQLGVEALRDVDVSQLSESSLGGEGLRRARHVVTENQRVLALVTALDRGRVDEVGELMTASHASLRDDFEVSTAQLDTVVQAALSAGALGARMTGGGFGGSAVALVPAALVPDVTSAVSAAGSAVGPTPDVFPVRPSAGARRVDQS